MSRSALVVGHPGHELRVFGWVAECLPRFVVLTDGSGHGDTPRLGSTDALLAALNLAREPHFPVASDRQLYAALGAIDIGHFVRAARRLAEMFIEHDIEQVVSDASEGFNPTHDLCRAMVDAAVQRAERMSGCVIASFAMPLTEGIQGGKEIHDARCSHFTLTEEMLERKLRAAHEYVELRDEVENAVAAHGARSFAVECLRRVVIEDDLTLGEKPFYEMWGERRVAEGQYDAVIRYADHMLPVLQALHRFAEHGGDSE